MVKWRIVIPAVVIIIIVVSILAFILAAPPAPAKPIKFGTSMTLTGALAAGGKAALLSYKICVDDINAKGGLLGRPVELIYYDDKTDPSLIPSLYEKLITVDKVDIILSSYGTVMVVPTIPIAQKYGMTFIGLFAFFGNEKFKYPYYFGIMPTGPDPWYNWSVGFFKAIRYYAPEYKTVAVLGVGNEYGKRVVERVIDYVDDLGFEVIYSEIYPPDLKDFTPLMSKVKTLNPDIVYVAAYPVDGSLLVSAAKEVDIRPKVFGGNIVGVPHYTPLMQKFGPDENYIVNYDFLNPAVVEKFPERFPGLKEFLKKYREKAPELGIDALGWYLPPYAYALCQVFEQAIRATGTLDQRILGEYIRTHKFKTVVGEVEFEPEYGEWKVSGIRFVQMNLTGTTLEEIDSPTSKIVIWPPEEATGKLVHPFPGWGVTPRQLK